MDTEIYNSADNSDNIDAAIVKLELELKHSSHDTVLDSCREAFQLPTYPSCFLRKGIQKLNFIFLTWSERGLLQQHL